MCIVVCQKWKPRTTPNPGELSENNFSIHKDISEFMDFVSVNASGSVYLVPDGDAFVVRVSNQLSEKLSDNGGSLFVKDKDINVVRCSECGGIIFVDGFKLCRGDKFICSTKCNEVYLSGIEGRKFKEYLRDSFQGRCQEYSC